MATKTLTKTTTGTRGRKPQAKSTDVDNTEEIVEEKPAKKAKKEFGQEDGILCRSITEGLLIVDGPKSSMDYRFPEYGVEIEIEYRDLLAIVRSKFELIKYPYFVILDEDFINEFPQIKQLYEQSYPLKELRSVLDLPVDEMIEQIEKLPIGAKDSLKNMVATDISLGRMDSASKIRALNKLYNVDFGIITDVFGGE